MPNYGKVYGQNKWFYHKNILPPFAVDEPSFAYARKQSKIVTNKFSSTQKLSKNTQVILLNNSNHFFYDKASPSWRISLVISL